MNISELLQLAFVAFSLGGYLIFVALILAVMVLSISTEKRKSNN